jgi:putative ABC transport system ATP-binding protein
MTLRLSDVTRTRGRGRHAVVALKRVSFAVGPGELVLLEGPSGSGKTTLLSVAAGLLLPDSGRVELAGGTISEMSQAERRAWRSRTVGFVFQRANLLDNLSVRDNVLVAAAVAGVPRSVATVEADRLLAALGIGGLADRTPAHLSGGEEHRAAVARALVHRPAMLLADEPTASLDWVSGRAVAEAMALLAREQGVAVLVASHDSRLRPFASRIARLADGVLATELA